MTASSSHEKDGEFRFVADPNSWDTKVWLVNFDDIITRAMGGTLSERPDLTGSNRILDLACGPGGWALQVARDHPEIELRGIDISEPMIQFANAQATSRGFGNVEFSVMDIKQPLRFDDATFDLVNERTLFGVMGPHEWPRLLAECKRVLHPGGIIRLTELEAPVTNSPALSEIWYLSTQAFKRTGRSFSPDDRHIGIIPMLEPLLKRAGFQDIHYHGHLLDISAGTPHAEGYRINFRYVSDLTRNFTLSANPISNEEFEQCYRHMLAEMLADDFRGYWTYVTVWGTKP